MIMKILQRLLILILLIHLTACRQNHCAQTNADSLLSSQVCSMVNEYSARHPQYKSLIFITDFEYNWRKGYEETQVILLGPSLDRLPSKYRLYPSQVLYYKDKLIFIQSSLGILYETSGIQKLYYKHSLKVDGRRDDITFFLREASAYQFNDIGKFRKISDRADTLILKKRVEFKAPPVMNNSSRHCR